MTTALRRLAAGLLVWAALAPIAWAADEAASSPIPPPDDGKGGSVFVRCDGSPAHESPAELAARLVAIVATAGLAGPGEMPDASKRVAGPAGVAACDAALKQETDRSREIELTLARSIHYIEANDPQAALADANAAAGIAGDQATQFDDAHSLMLSARELQAAALLRLNRPAEAEQVALTMAESAPYDLYVQLHASTYIGLTAGLTPQKRSFYDRFGRLWTKGLIARVSAEEWAGDYASAATDLEAMTELSRAYTPTDKTPLAEVALLAARSIDLAMSGDLERSDALAVKTRSTVDDLFHSGAAANEQGAVSSAEEALAFQRIVSLLAHGGAVDARAAFRARDRWSMVNPATVAAVAGKLREAAPAAELTGLLAKTPDAIRAEGLAARAGAILKRDDAAKSLFLAIRFPVPLNSYNALSGAVWRTSKSPYLIKRTEKATYAGELFAVSGTAPFVLGDALMMHCALVARARGKAGFTLAPARPRLYAVQVIVGNPGDPGVPAAAMLKADDVVAALSAEFPQPSR